MGAWSKIITMTMRIVQLICAVIMIEIATDYIVTHKSEDLGHLSRFIFTDCVSGISLFFAFIWLVPFSSNHMNWYIDAIVFVLSLVMSGWLIYSAERTCGKPSTNDFEAITQFDDDNAAICVRWKALYVFSVVSAGLWLISAGVGFFWARKNFKTVKSEHTVMVGK